MYFKACTFIFTTLVFFFVFKDTFAQQGPYLFKKLKYHKSEVLSIAFSPDGCYLLSGSADNKVVLYDIEQDKTILDFEAHLAGVQDVDFLSMGQKFITAGDKSIKVWSFEGVQEKIFRGHYTYIWSFGVNPSNTYIVSGSYEDDFYLWDFNKNELITRVKGHDKSVLAVAISPDNKIVATGSLDQTVKIWELETQNLIHTFEGHAGNIMALTFSKDGRYLLSASLDKNLKLWDVQNKTFVMNYVGHENGVLCCDFSSDRRHIISAGMDKSIKLWETSTAECIYIFNSHEEAVNSICYSPSGESFASGSNDKTVIIWSVEPEIFVNYYYVEEFYEELENSGLWGPKRDGESRDEFKVRSEEADKYKKSLIEKYYQKYLKEIKK